MGVPSMATAILILLASVAASGVHPQAGKFAGGARPKSDVTTPRGGDPRGLNGISRAILDRGIGMLGLNCSPARDISFAQPSCALVGALRLRGGGKGAKRRRQSRRAKERAAKTRCEEGGADKMSVQGGFIEKDRTRSKKEKKDAGGRNAEKEKKEKEEKEEERSRDKGTTTMDKEKGSVEKEEAKKRKEKGKKQQDAKVDKHKKNKKVEEEEKMEEVREARQEKDKKKKKKVGNDEDEEDVGEDKNKKHKKKDKTHDEEVMEERKKDKKDKNMEKKKERQPDPSKVNAVDGKHTRRSSGSDMDDGSRGLAAKVDKFRSTYANARQDEDDGGDEDDDATVGQGEIYGSGTLVGMDRSEKRRTNRRQLQRDMKAAATAGFGIRDDSKASNMLKAMGWSPGEGLGKDGGGMKSAIRPDGKSAGDTMGIGAVDPTTPWGLMTSINKAADDAFASPIDLSKLQAHFAQSRVDTEVGDVEVNEGKGGKRGGKTGASKTPDVVEDDGTEQNRGQSAPRKGHDYMVHIREEARQGDKGISSQSSHRLNPTAGKEFKKQKGKLKNKQTFGSIDMDYRTPNRIIFD